MAYYPKSQIKSNLHTNGGEYILSTTRQYYIGYYYELSNGKKYTGKSPNDTPNILLLLPQKSSPSLVVNASPNQITTNNIQGRDTTSPTPFFDSSYPLPKDLNVLPRLLPQYNPTIPTSQDKDLGVFSRYFCKKTNELIYLEIDKQTYYSLSSRSSTIAWDLYIPLTTFWYIKGDKEKTYKANKGLISLIEQNQKWYGFSKYLKEDFLKYYSA